MKKIVLTGCTKGLGRALVDEFVALGHTVPLFVGNALLPRHVVLGVGGDDRALTAYDPASGRTARLTRDRFASGTLRVSGWSEPWFAVLPLT